MRKLGKLFLLSAFAILVATGAAQASGLIWENDMSTDPTSGVTPNWAVRGGATNYTMSSGQLVMGTGAWSTLLDTDPFDEYEGTTDVDLTWRATTAGEGGAGLWCNFDGDADLYAYVRFEAVLQTNGTQTVQVLQSGELASHDGFGTGMLTLTAVLDALQYKADYIVTDGTLSVTNSVNLAPADIAGLGAGCTLYTTGSGAEVDYVRIESLAAPANVYIAADPDALNMILAESETSVTGTVGLEYNAATNLNLNITISDENYPGSFTVVSATNQVLDLLGASTLEFEFDKTAHGLLVGNVATGLATLAWSEVGGGESGQIVIPLSGSISAVSGENTWVGAGDGVSWNDPANWVLGRVPGALAPDTALIQDGDTVTVSPGAPTTYGPLPELNVRFNGLTGSTLNIDGAIPDVLNMYVGRDAGFYGFVNQSTAAVVVSNLVIGTGGELTNSVYSLTGGSLTLEEFSIPGKGVMVVDGGTLTLDNSSGPTFNSPYDAGGLMQIKSGTFTSTTPGGTQEWFHHQTEISGGTVSVLNHIIPTKGFTVIGDDATITFNATQMPAHLVQNLTYVLDETGVSSITNLWWSNTLGVTWVIDGSAYAGGTKEITLFYAPNLTVPDPLPYTITGFDPSMTAEVYVDVISGDEKRIVLSISVPGYDGWIAEHGLTGPEAEWDYDADFDAEDNGYEYCFGGDPTNPAVKGFVPSGQVVDISGTDYYKYFYSRRIASGAELEYIPQFTSDLTDSWTDVSASEVGSSVIDDDNELVTIQVDITGKPEGFMNVIVNQL